MTMPTNECIVCGSVLEYSVSTTKKRCVYCDAEYDANAECSNGHYVCDICHSSEAADVIMQYCISTHEQDPIYSAQILMKHPSVKMHGPEHHFLVPAVLIAAYYSVQNELSSEGIIKKLTEARNRAKNVLGGFCGFYGTCGAAIGVGIFISLITNATPVSEESWKLANLATAQALEKIAVHGGPRCCKRDTFLALQSACTFLKRYFNVTLIQHHITCTFFRRNTQCRQTECIYYPDTHMPVK